MTRFVVLLVSLSLSTCLSVIERPRIAIIGAGIGGTSCAYFLRSLFGENLDLDLYEAEEIGGRLAVTQFGGKSYEIGGSIIHSRNKYMVEFRNLLKLKKREESKNSFFGIFNGNDFVFEESTWEIITLFRLLRLYHFGFWKLRRHINQMLDSFEKIYRYQDDGVTFQNVTTLLSAMDPEFVDYLRLSSKVGFQKEGLSDNLINELILATIRTNYGQDLRVHKFVGSVSVAGASGGLWAFDGGNAQVSKKLFELSQAQLIKSPVDIVRKLPTNKLEIVTDSESGMGIINYDIVILAAPQTSDMKHLITFDNFTNQLKFPGKYHQTVCTLIKGKLNDSYFPQKKKFIDGILSINNSLIFNSIGRINPVDYKAKSSGVSDVWKIFSQRLLSEKELTSLFTEIKEKYVKIWLAYPEYDTTQRDDSFVLDNNLYHINAIDWAASSMEMSVIGARNVALLAFKNWQEREAADQNYLHENNLRDKNEL